MNEPLDSRPQNTVNRLRFLVIVPVLVTCIGVFFLATQLARHLRERKELAVQEAPTNRPASAGAAGQSTPAVPRPTARAGTTTAAQPRAISGTTVPTAEVATGETGALPVVANPPTPQKAPAPRTAGVFALPTNGIVGRVFLRGVPPPAQELPLDPSCGKLHGGAAQPRTRFYIVNTNGALADVFVVLHGLPAARWEPPASPLEIRQRGCEYLPYVSAVQVGQVIRVFNDDPLMHNVHPTPTVGGNKEQNRVQLNAAAPPLDHSFPRPESFLRFKCDVHQWMFAYVSVVEHPFFAVSSVDGQFALPEPPPGNYVLQLIHRKTGEKSVPVTVRPGKRLTVHVTLDLTDAAKSEATVTEE